MPEYTMDDLIDLRPEHRLIENRSKKNKLPSYIAPDTLSAVLLEVIAKERNSNLGALG